LEEELDELCEIALPHLISIR